MSNKKRRIQGKSSEVIGSNLSGSAAGQTNDPINQSNNPSWLIYLRRHWWAVGIIAFLSLGALGAGLSYLEADAKRQKASQANPASRQENQSWLNRINPFISVPLPTSTPDLAKEYVYAGSRLLAVEDVKADAAPPADLAVWRKSTRWWYVLGGEGSQQTAQQFGDLGDQPVPGDFDGDGKTDFSVFRPSTGYWWIYPSSGIPYYGFQFGELGDKTAQADYDGDGKTDASVYRASNATWYIWRGTMLDYLQVPFGLEEDIPAPADYDGDGKADIALWRNSQARFHILRSSDGGYQFQDLGQNGDVPVCGDYDGDGKADFALKRGADWIIRNSSTNQQQPTIPWENATDIAVPNDYDGDGKVDIAVWREATGYWYIRNSSDNSTRSVQWGLPEDIPVPAFYRR